MFGVEKETMSAVTIDATAMEEKRILRGRGRQTTEEGDSVL
jgi:hypothetical protein